MVPQSVFKTLCLLEKRQSVFILLKRQVCTTMNCPYCQKPMEAGYLSSGSPVFWSEAVSGFPVPTQQSDVPLGGKLGLVARPRAFLCRNCRIVLTRYQ